MTVCPWNPTAPISFSSIPESLMHFWTANVWEFVSAASVLENISGSGPLKFQTCASSRVLMSRFFSSSSYGIKS